MKTSELLLRLKKGMKQYASKVKSKNDCLDVNDASVPCTMFRYNLKNFHEIINLSPEGLDDEVDEEKLRDLENRIDNYITLHAPVDEEFKEFIKLISIYLTFISRKPLHPPGIMFSDGTTVYEDGDVYYCTARKLHLSDEYSLCRCCVSRSKN